MFLTELLDELKNWLAGLKDQYAAEWERLPDIGLYMDQVQTYIDRQLGLYRLNEEDKLLTPAMINNYIKDGLIPRAEAKKYGPVHLALLIMIATLKQVLSIQDLNQLLSDYREPEPVASLYRQFLHDQRCSLQDTEARVIEELDRLTEKLNQKESEALDSDVMQALRELSLALCIEARTKILVAQKIMSILSNEQTILTEQDQKNNKKKEKNHEARS